MLNEDQIPDYLKEARFVLLSKTGKTSATLDDTREGYQEQVRSFEK